MLQIVWFDWMPRFSKTLRNWVEYKCYPCWWIWSSTTPQSVSFKVNNDQSFYENAEYEKERENLKGIQNSPLMYNRSNVCDVWKWHFNFYRHFETILFTNKRKRKRNKRWSLGKLLVEGCIKMAEKLWKVGMKWLWRRPCYCFHPELTFWNERGSPFL